MNDLAAFQLWLTQSDRKGSTIRLVSHTIERVQRRIGDLTSDSILSYLIQLKQEGKRGRYLNTIVTALHLYGQFKGLPYLTEIHRFKNDRFDKACLSDEEIEQFLALPCPTFWGTNWNTGKKFLRKSDPVGWEKMRIFWSICAFSGMRMGEVSHLQIENVDFGRGVFTIEEGKTGHRVVPIAPNISLLLSNYVKSTKGTYLFTSRRGGKKGEGCVDSVDLGYSFKKRLQIMGLKRTNLSPYSFRHSFCTRLLEEDIAFPKVMKIMGHRRAETTLQYTHMTTKDVIEAIKKLPLIRKSTDPKNILHSLCDIVRSMSIDRDSRFEYSLTETSDEVTMKVKIREDYDQNNIHQTP